MLELAFLGFKKLLGFSLPELSELCDLIKLDSSVIDRLNFDDFFVEDCPLN
jgi:hypothetical protein